MPKESEGSTASGDQHRLFVSDPRDVKEMVTVGTIAVHEFITLDGVIEAPSWSFDYPHDPAMGEAIGAVMGSCTAILLGAAPTRSSPRRGRAAPPRKIPARRS